VAAGFRVVLPEPHCYGASVGPFEGVNCGRILKSNMRTSEPRVTFSDAMPFSRAAVAAFPFSYRMIAESAARTLAPFTDDSYRIVSVHSVVLGETVQIPIRIHLVGLDEGKLHHRNCWHATQCLCTRSTDGYLRHASLRHVLPINEPWSIPFVVLLAGEYVVEIIEDMIASVSALDRERYVNFVRENRILMRLLRQKANSYWDCYYRRSYPDRNAYPGVAFLGQLELWAG
jgi:hypothetical protein